MIVTSIVGKLPNGGWNVIADGKLVVLRSSAKSVSVIKNGVKKYLDVLKRLACD